LTYAVCVTFVVKEGAMQDFLPLMRRNASMSLSSEPACKQFDVLTDPSRPSEIFLYELYDDRAAFDFHLKSDHFRQFEAEAKDMIATKTVATYRSVVQ